MIIVALDTHEHHHALNLIKLFHHEELYPQDLWFKVGMELFYSSGKSFLHDVANFNVKIFLDLKLHDIPHTVFKTLKALRDLPFHMINVHALGGSDMMKKAREAIETHFLSPRLLAVTQLTSSTTLQMNDEQKIKGDISDSVLHLASLAKNSGCHGIVCSPWEVQTVKKTLGEHFITVTPGIRPISHDSHDQQRTMTPEEAKNQGTDFMVIGRPITSAADPLKAYQEIIKTL